VVLGVYKPVR